MTIKDLRALSGMTQKDFAEYFGVSRRTVQSWELGDRKCMEYVVELMRYKLEKEHVIRQDGPVP